jgi:uncharacterized phage-associated protein
MSDHINDLSKTKALKLLYLLEEYSVKKFQTPFFGIEFQAWQAGPVAKDVYIDLSNDGSVNPILREFISVKMSEHGTYVQAKAKFNDDEFSDNDITIMDYVIKTYGKKTATQLVKIVHEPHTAWHNTAQMNDLLEPFTLGRSNSSDIPVDLSFYLTECEKSKYLEIKETWEALDALKKQ